MSEVAEHRLSIPDHWSWTTLDEVGEWGSGGTPKSTVKKYYGGKYPWLKIGDLNDGPVSTSETTITQKGLDESSAKLVPKEALLIAMYGSIGKLGITKIECATNQAIAFCIPDEKDASLKFLFWCLRFFRSELVERGKGGTQQNISQTVLKNFAIPIPPLSEQRRIVAKIEELFSNLDAGMDDLQTAQRQLERHRLSVLQAAVEGRLTADWRRTHAPEPADQLLERILEKRREKWEEQYAWERYESKGKELPRGWKSRYKDPKEPAKKDELPELPEGWIWTSLDALTWNNVDYRGKTPPYSDSGILTISAGNIKDGKVTFDSRKKYVSEDTYEKWLTRGEPEAGDLIITTEAPVGATAILPGDETYLLTRRVLACQTLQVENRFLQMCFSAGATQRHLRANSRGTTVPRILKKVLFQTPLPLPPLAEQKQIVTEVERLLSVADDAVTTVERERTRAERLRQSILKQAFSGQLVPHEQDATVSEASAPAQPGEQIEMGL